LTLKVQDLKAIRYRLNIEEPRVIRRANILNCLHLGYTSIQIAQILNVDRKTVTNVGDAYLEGGLESALFDEERSGRPIDFDDRERSRIVACARPRRKGSIAGRWI
jgi:transposase